MEIVHGSVYGYRIWYLLYNYETKLPELFPTVVGYEKWSYGVTEAQCASAAHDDANIVPEDYCTCGLYALSTDDRIHKTVLPRIFGHVELFGRVIHHERGYRTQYAKVYSLDSIVLCNFCFSHDIYRNINLNDEDTMATFDVLPSALELKYVKRRRISQALCPECAERAISQYRYTILEPPYDNRIDRCITKSKPLFDVLTQLYCDGRILYLTG